MKLLNQMLIDRDVRFSLLSTIEILKHKNEWLTVKDIIDCLQMRMNRIYDRRSIYQHIKNLELFGYVETKVCKNNTKFVRWIWTS